MNTEESTVVDQKAVGRQEPAVRETERRKGVNTEKSPVVDQKVEPRQNGNLNAEGSEAMLSQPSNIRHPTSAIPSSPRWTRIREFLEARRPLFAAQGSIVASWRTYRGRRLGPYYRLAYREAGRQCSLYLGRSLELLESVRQTLASFQRSLRERQVFRRLRSAARKALRTSKARLRQQLAAVGIRLKGLEFRGVRAAFARRQTAFFPPSPAPSLPPPFFIPPVPPSLRKWFWGTACDYSRRLTRQRVGENEEIAH